MNAFCILYADGFSSSHAGELSGERTLASVPFGGRFRLVDFMLSCLVGAKVHDIGIVARNKYGSLMDHVGWGKDWDLNRKNGGLKFLTPFLQNATAVTGDNEFDILANIRSFITSRLPEYCILATSNVVFNSDLNKLFAFHTEKGADISFLYKRTPPDAQDMEVTIDADGRMIDALYHSEKAGQEAPVLLNAILLKKQLLLSLIEKGQTYGWTSIKRDMIARNLHDLRIYGMENAGYSAVINSVGDYFRASMELLTPEVRRQVFHGTNPILTRIKDSVPTMYGEDNLVLNSLIADGCRVNGYVENSILFRDVKVAKGAVVKNSILMQNTVVEEGATLSCVIADKDVRITANRLLAGSETMPFIINKGRCV